MTKNKKCLQEAATSQADTMTNHGDYNMKKIKYKHFNCTKCDKVWNVPSDTKFEADTYICPHCAKRKRI